MANPLRPQQHHLSWPLTPSQVEGMEDMFVTLFKRLAATSTASASATTSGSPQGVPGQDGQDGQDSFIMLSSGGGGLTAPQIAARISVRV